MNILDSLPDKRVMGFVTKELWVDRCNGGCCCGTIHRFPDDKGLLLLDPDDGSDDDDKGRCGVIKVDRQVLVDGAEGEYPVAWKEGVGDDDDNVVDCLSLRGDTECLLRGGITLPPSPPFAPPSAVVVGEVIRCAVVAKVADALSWSMLLQV